MAQAEQNFGVLAEREAAPTVCAWVIRAISPVERGMKTYQGRGGSPQRFARLFGSRGARRQRPGAVEEIAARDASGVEGYFRRFYRVEDTPCCLRIKPRRIFFAAISRGRELNGTADKV